MVQIENKLHSKIAALYAPCKVYSVPQSTEYFIETLEGVNITREIFYVEGEEQTNIEDYKLVLTPLANITDVDSIELARLGLYEGVNAEKVGRDIIDRVINWKDYSSRRMCFAYEQADYLRSKGYMLPAYGVADLFEAGVAINKH